jgi:excisionase family DNA binding protein
MERLAYSLQDAADAVGIGLRTLQALIAKGDIIAVYSGRKPLVTADELKAWLGRLPSEPPGR